MVWEKVKLTKQRKFVVTKKFTAFFTDLCYELMMGPKWDEDKFKCENFSMSLAGLDEIRSSQQAVCNYDSV